ncbi:MAG: flippase [Clostridia bacterium]|nr:flippase [Clostridia bacterium]
MIRRYLKNATVKNAGWLIFGKIAQMLISLAVGLLTARYLGPSNYGLINYAGAYVAFFMAFCTLGINSVLVKEFIDNPDDEGKIIGSTLALRAVSSLLSAGMIVCCVLVLESDEPTTIAVTALSTIGLLFSIFETFNYWFQAKLKSKVTTIVSLIAYIVTSAYRIVLLVLQKSVQWFAMASAIDYICISVLLFVCYKRWGGKRLSFSRDISKRLLSKSVHFILPALMVSIYGYADKFMLKHMLSEAEVGYYSTAVTLCTMWCFVLSAIIDSVYPSIMSSHKDDKALFEKRNRQLYATVFYISVAASVIFCIFGGFAVKLLYGADYLPAAAPLRVITWYTAFSYLGVARNAWIVCENKEKYLKYIYVSAALGNVVLNFGFIPLWGATGAALASLVTQVLATVIVPLFIKDIRRNSVLMLEGICLKGVR